ncbi:MAG: cell division protein FtsQ/DivIB [Sphingopyxis sp.]
MSRTARKPQTVKRGKAARPKTTPRRRSRGPSLWQRLLGAQPLPPAAIRRIAITLLLGLFVLAAWQIGDVTGVNAYARAEAVEAVGRADFSVKRVEVVGANRIDRLHVYDIALGQKDRSMAALDLDDIRRDLLRYGWVADARVSRRLPDTLVIDLVERSPVAVWQNRGNYTLIDVNGRLLPGVDAASVPGLPVLVGRGALAQMHGLQELLASAPALRVQLAGASWVGNRRWDLHFKTGETLALPDDAAGARSAFAEFARMDGVNRLLGRGVQRFDMRIADRFVLRPGRAGALEGIGTIDGGDRQVETAPPQPARPGA